MRDDGEVEWVRYRRADALEAMHARFESHVYHRHAHETYSFGVTEEGAQEFTCRGGKHTSAAGMVMAFNPDDPHDGWAATESGFTYRMVHIGPELFGSAPLFATPVVWDPAAAAAVRSLHAALMGPATALVRDERLARALATLRRQATGRSPAAARAPAASPTLAALVLAQLRDSYLEDLSAEELAAAVGHSRFAVYRAFRRVYGMSPGEYQRLLRLRAARDLLASGHRPAEAAAATGFADQAHLTRWFVRSFGLTPGAFRRASMT